MIKKCKVLTRNVINMIVVYDGIELQMPTDNSCEKEIYIKKVNDTFVISSEEEYIKSTKKKQKKESEAELAKVDNEITTDDIQTE